MKQLCISLSLLLFFACSKEDDSTTLVDEETEPQFAEVDADLRLGLWAISSYIDRSEDETMDFVDVEFDFKEEGVVIGQNDLFSEPGTWEYTVSNSIEFKELLVLEFNGTEPFPNLSENWEIVAATSTMITLEYDTVDVNKTLVFTKI